MKFIHAGFQNFINKDRIIAVIRPEGNGVKNLIRKAEKEGKIINITHGRSRKAVIVLDSDHLVLCGVGYDTIIKRLNKGSYKIEKGKLKFCDDIDEENKEWRIK